jgi:DNA polymerase I-like protein with 3'-5' exonuclease and polymerase domains
VLLAAGAQLPPTSTGTGNASVAAPVLEPLRGTPGRVGEVATAVLDYRHHDTVIGTFLAPYQLAVTYGDGRVRPTVYTLGTDTGRMSCVRPNLQQLPREGGIRACLTADPGHLLISADFRGVELRVAAALSGDTTLRRMIADGVDIHGLIARQVFGPGATKADRYAVKRGVFGRLYGGGVPTLARQVGCSELVAAAMVATLDEMTPQLTAWAARLRQQVTGGRTRYRTYTGAVVYLPRAHPHKAPNYVIQRTARELLVDALLRWHTTPWGGSAVLLPVHDEILVMVPEHDAPAATNALVTCMQTELNGVPILAEASAPSYAWADAA